jgi:putative ABC transport system permease protein
MWALLRTFSWRELRHHPWRSATAVVAVMLGVALGFAVHVINASALDEFAQAVRTVGGQPDLELRPMQGSIDEALYAPLATHPDVARASPWLELSTPARRPGQSSGATLRVLGADALLLPALAPALLPRLLAGQDRLALFAPATVFLNTAALQALGLDAAVAGGATVLLQTGLREQPVRIAGTVAAGGPPLAVMDIGAAQDFFGRTGQLSRIDLQLRPGVSPQAFAQALRTRPGWPAALVATQPGDAVQRVDSLSRAYRVNLTVLALVALFTGAFLVFSVLALSVAQRAPQFALLAVLGATPRERLGLVLAESTLLGLAGSAAGIALGTALAATALRLLGGDLGGGYFAGARPALQWSAPAAVAFGALGVAAALVGGWWPARAAQALPPAATLKGLGMALAPGRQHATAGLGLLATGLALAWAPPVFGMPLAAYVAVGLLLVGGIALLPWGVGLLLRRLPGRAQGQPLALLALERARRMRGSAAVAVGGVVASLSLAVALTVMVTSFRSAVNTWLDTVLPAPVYLRMPSTGGDAAPLPDGLVTRIAQLPGVERVQALRSSSLLLDPTRPPVALLARPLGAGPARTLPLTAPALPVPPGRTALYVSEAAAALYDLHPGGDWPLLSQAFGQTVLEQQSSTASFFIAGIWRDYARQFGAVAIDKADYEHLSGDTHATDLALWPRAGGDLTLLREAVAALAPGLEFTTTAQIRERSLRLFDRSFAVTYWLQAVAIGIGLFGVAASFSAQVLARRKEFGLLAHLGLTRGQILTVVAAEGAAWTALGAVAGTALGLAVAVILVHVVNPQSFHWTMELAIPWPRLCALAASVVAAGTLTAWLAGRAAAGRSAVLAVKEDW